MIQWKDDYLLGIDEVDNQHRELFRIASEAYDLLKNPFLDDKYDRIVEIINELKKYAVFHFQTEEDYMKKIGYKRYLSHKVQHDDFVEKVKKVDFEQVDQQQDEYILSILEFVVGWIDNHILHTDKLIVEK